LKRFNQENNLLPFRALRAKRKNLIASNQKTATRRLSEFGGGQFELSPPNGHSVGNRSEQNVISHYIALGATGRAGCMCGKNPVKPRQRVQPAGSHAPPSPWRSCFTCIGRKIKRNRSPCFRHKPCTLRKAEHRNVACQFPSPDTLSGRWTRGCLRYL